MKKLCTILIWLMLVSTAHAIDYTADRKVDQLDATGSALTPTTRVLVQDPADTDKVAYSTPVDIIKAAMDQDGIKLVGIDSEPTGETIGQFVLTSATWNINGDGNVCIAQCVETGSPGVWRPWVCIDQVNNVLIWPFQSLDVIWRAGLNDLDDDSYDGKILSGRNVGETVAQWETVYLNPADGEFHQADANAAGECPAWGVAVSAGIDGTDTNILIEGIVRNDGWTWSAVNVPLYLSTTAGGITETAPTTTGECVQLIGRSLSDDEAKLNFTGHYFIVE